MALDGTAAARTLLARGVCTPGLCLYYVWQAYKAHGAQANGTYGTAYAAWLGSPGQHPGDRNPPPGVPVYWGPRAGSSAGDVVISLGNGRVAATDWPHNGVIGETTIDARERQIGRPYLGWTDNILGHPITVPQTKEWDEMASKDEIRSVVQEEIAAAVSKLSDNLRREARYRLFQNADTKQYAFVRFDLPAGDPRAIIYVDEANIQNRRASFYTNYQMVGDDVHQAHVVGPAQFASLATLVDGTDIAFTNRERDA